MWTLVHLSSAYVPGAHIVEEMHSGGGSSSASYGAIAVILIPFAIIIFVVVLIQMKHRRKYTLERNYFGMHTCVPCKLSYP